MNMVNKNLVGTHNNFYQLLVNFSKIKSIILHFADAFSAENLGFVCFLNDQPNPAKPSMVEPV